MSHLEQHERSSEPAQAALVLSLIEPWHQLGRVPCRALYILQPIAP